MLCGDMTLWDIINTVLLGFEPKFLTEESIEYRCYCSRERVEQALASIGKDELAEMEADGKPIDVTCQFCDRIYTFTVDEIKSLRAVAE